MISNKKDPSKYKKVMPYLLKNIWGALFIKIDIYLLKKFVKKSRAPIEHLFNCHEWCNSEWC